MRNRKLKTIPDLIASNLTCEKDTTGYIQSFTPKNTDTRYCVRTKNPEPVVKEGENYNVGYWTENDTNWTSLEDIVLRPNNTPQPNDILASLRQSIQQIFQREKTKNDTRVFPHEVHGEYYWGKKYAWRVFGLCLSKEAFYKYLEEIKHPTIKCIVKTQGYPEGDSIAYAEKGLLTAVETLINSAQKDGRYYKSPRYSRSFEIKPVGAYSDKK